MTTIDRRAFLGALGGSLTVLLSIDARELLALGRQQGRGYPSDFNAYLRIGENGRVTLFTGKIEMGQGVNTSLAQMLAEELDVPLAAIDPVLGDTDLCPWDMGTFGSMTTRFFGPPLRAAGAEAKAVLLQLASERLDVPVARLATRAGTVVDRERPEVSVAYGELVRGQKLERHIAGVTPEPLAQHTVCGVASPRLDARAKVTGEALYAGDIRVPGMLYAAVLRPPAHGATLLEADTAGTAAVAGARVVRDGDLLAVLHELPDVAAHALAQVRARWDVPAATVSNENLFEHLATDPPPAQVVAERGSVEAGVAASVKIEEATYYNQYVAHSPIETHTALAQLAGDKLTVWVSTQTPFPARDEIARAVGMQPERVRVIKSVKYGAVEPAAGPSCSRARHAK